MGILVASALIRVNLIAMAVAQWSTTLSRIMFLGGPVIYYAPIKILRRRPSTPAEADEFD